MMREQVALESVFSIPTIWEATVLLATKAGKSSRNAVAFRF